MKTMVNFEKQTITFDNFKDKYEFGYCQKILRYFNVFIEEQGKNFFVNEHKKEQEHLKKVLFDGKGILNKRVVDTINRTYKKPQEVIDRLIEQTK